MKAAQREPWLILTGIGDSRQACMCTFCQYASWSGSPCSCMEVECEHPLYDRSIDFENMAIDRYFGGDCWGFRPDISREDAADIVGIWLRGEHPDWETVPRLYNKPMHV